MTKVIFFDVDGTLLSHSQKCVPDSAKRALDALAKKEILRVLATGRHTLELQVLPLALPLQQIFSAKMQKSESPTRNSDKLQISLRNRCC
jgi:hydroxymethylpyrimidine pyrophosphatase-like HAD family hydrolase